MNAGHTPGYLLKQINEALRSAFPDKTELEMMVLYELNINLNEVASGGNLKRIVHKLIEHCQAYNKLEQLIDGALKQNPNNVQLKAINKEFKITTSLINILIPLERKLIKQMQQAYRACCHYEFRDDRKDEIPDSFYDILKKLNDIPQATDDEKLIVKFVDHLLFNGNIPKSQAEQLKQWLKYNSNNFYKLLVYKQNLNRQPDSRRSKSGKQIVLKQFSFEVVTVNGRGVIINRESQQASYFTEDLGNKVDLEMVSIPAGSFLMGSSKSERGSSDRERPVHQVSIQPFLLGKYQVTQAQWRAVVENLPKVNRDLDPDPSQIKGENRPVEGVNWYDAVEFCDRLSEHMGTEYRLPSEAEWEYACRAGTTTPFHYGETITSRFANYNASDTYAQEARGYYRGETTPVGSFPPNGFGLYDMHGNVLEWCGDPDHGNYKGAPTDGSIWTEFDNYTDSYILRGGSWISNPRYCRSASRDIYNARDHFSRYVGFRVARGVG
ncbi:SUMF1/EgtB/PvdO family nonheme iron enzyme [Moorena sp. SIO3H5]|uniref:SUMF1/EgtB/PvdO family nonheme iron enzyme n=1 Tax=Moorena sp. SIO3H5 TaxID=2607834 RepID=UPI0013BA8C45|nr:SUMF1/EgtB/PvdO family nonheme iron enzyme [Moorena sp. SIO3H5]NEO73659.1 formylglycine-generating enzyme family protein [Moorena sp. SIO3H5]